MELMGVPLFGMGLLLLVWIVVAGGLLVWHAKTAGENRDLAGYLVPALLGAAAIFFLPRVFPEGLPIRGYGVMLLIAVSTGMAMGLASREATWHSSGHDNFTRFLDVHLRHRRGETVLCNRVLGGQLQWTTSDRDGF